MVEACLRMVRQYTDFKGRAKRSEFWGFFVFHSFITLTLIFVIAALGFRFGIVELLLIFIIMPLPVVMGLAVSVRRLHDTGRSGLWVLIGFVNFIIPLVGIIILLILMTLPSEEGENKYGVQPL